jgi:hypothetical protein
MPRLMSAIALTLTLLAGCTGVGRPTPGDQAMPVAPGTPGPPPTLPQETLLRYARNYWALVCQDWINGHTPLNFCVPFAQSFLEGAIRSPDPQWAGVMEEAARNYHLLLQQGRLSDFHAPALRPGVRQGLALWCHDELAGVFVNEPPYLTCWTFAAAWSRRLPAFNQDKSGGEAYWSLRQHSSAQDVFTLFTQARQKTTTQAPRVWH